MASHPKERPGGLSRRDFLLRSAGAATVSPLVPLYDAALRLRGSELASDSAGVALARGYFAMQFESGHEPLADVLTSIPADFTQAAP